MSINHVTISGNLTRDAELRQTQSGNPILSVGVAVNDRVKNQQTGAWEDRPNFIDCVLFGQRAEKVAGYLTKGTKVTVAGKLRYSTWEREGQKRSKVEVVIEDLDFMSSGQRQQAPAAPQYQQQAPQYQQTQQYQQATAAPQYPQVTQQQFQQQVQPASYQQPVQQQMPPQAPMQQAPIQQMQAPIDPASIAYESEDIPF